MGLSLSGLGGLVVPKLRLSYQNKIFNSPILEVLNFRFWKMTPTLTPGVFAAAMKRNLRDSDKVEVISAVVDSLALLCGIGLERRHSSATHGSDVLTSKVPEWLLKISDANCSWE